MREASPEQCFSILLKIPKAGQDISLRTFFGRSPVKEKEKEKKSGAIYVMSSVKVECLLSPVIWPGLSLQNCVHC